jgi:hypothetical protein
MAFEVRVPCPTCRVEGARVEMWDAGDALLEARPCRLCSAAGPGDAAPGLPRTPADLHCALAAWAADEGLDSAEELVEAYFVLPSVDAIFAALSRGEPVETTFDVVDYLFSSGGGTGGAAAVDLPPSVRPPMAAPRAGSVPIGTTIPMGPATDAPVSRSFARFGGPYDELLALASVAAADGEASEDDQATLAEAAARRGIPPLPPHEVRVRRPGEIDPPATLGQREVLLKEMFWMAWSDSELDESELRVVRAFARAWGVDPQRVQEWTDIVTHGDDNFLERWVTRIGRFLFPGW